MRVKDDTAALFEAFGEFLAGQHDVHDRSLLIHEGIGCHHVKAQQAACEVTVDFVNPVHDCDGLNIQRFELCRRLAAHIAVETGWGQEGMAFNTRCCQFAEPLGGHGVGVTE